MPDTNLELAAHFMRALYAATHGRPGQFRQIYDCAQLAGLTDAAHIELAWNTAEAARFVVVRVDELSVMLTSKGLQAAGKNRDGL
jgi:hypothetical protein